MPTDDEIRRVIRRELRLDQQSRGRRRFSIVRPQEIGPVPESVGDGFGSREIAVICGAFMMIVATLLVSAGVAAQTTWALGVLLEVASWSLFAAGGYCAFVLRRSLGEIQPV